MRLYKQDPEKARECLTKYSHDMANGAVEAYWKLAEDLWSKYTNYFETVAAQCLVGRWPADYTSVRSPQRCSRPCGRGPGLPARAA